MRNNMTKINQWWDEIIMPADEEPLHENHEEDGKSLNKRALMQSRYNHLSLIFHFVHFHENLDQNQS